MAAQTWPRCATPVAAARLHLHDAPDHRSESRSARPAHAARRDLAPRRARRTAAGTYRAPRKRRAPTPIDAARSRAVRSARAAAARASVLADRADDASVERSRL